MPLVPWKKGSFGKGFLPKSPAAERPVLHLWRTDDEGYPFHLHGLSSYGVETDDVSALFAVNRDGAVTFLGGDPVIAGRHASEWLVELDDRLSIMPSWERDWTSDGGWS